MSGSELRVTIAGITTSILSSEADLTLGATGPLAAFLDPVTTPDITLDVCWDVPPELRGERLYDSGGVWQLFRDGDRLAFHLHSPRFGDRPYKSASFAPDFTSGTIHLRRHCFDPSRPLYPLEYPLDELLVTNWLALGRGVEVHACAVVDGGGAGYLFVGHSGAGKTTMARQWCEEPGVTVLSDDRVVLRRDAGRIWMHGTPWHGDEPLASHGSAPLARTFFLRHASRNQVDAVSGADAVAGLFACSFPPPFSAAAIDFTLSFLTDVAQAAPVFELGFVPDRHIRDFIRVAA